MTPTASDVSSDIRPPARQSVPWKNTPLVVGTISTAPGLSHLMKAPEGIDLVEVRLDLLLSKGSTQTRFKRPWPTAQFLLFSPCGPEMKAGPLTGAPAKGFFSS